jgi:hypothetical protein
MGGSGSGWQGSSKTTVEDCLVLSAAKIQRDGFLRSCHRWWGSLTWRNTLTGEELSSIGFETDTGADRGWARLHYTRRGIDEPMDYRVTLTATPLPWGGMRWWFVCPLTTGGRSCTRRVGKLHLPPGGRYFGCRHCYGLTYTSCQESHKFDTVLASIGGPMGLTAKEVAKLLNTRR